MFALQAIERQQCEQAAENEQQKFTGQRWHQPVAGAFSVEQGAQLPVATGQGECLQTVRLFCGGNRGGAEAFSWRVVSACNDPLAQSVLEQPLMFATLLITQPVVQYLGLQAQHVMTVVGLAQQQVQRAAFTGAEGVVIVVRSVMPQQLADKGLVT